MSRKLKSLGLAFVFVLALSGIAAAGAQAETAVESHLKSGKTQALVLNDVQEDGKLGRVTIGTGARFVECTELGLTGVGTQFEGSAKTLVGTPVFGKCFSNGLLSAPATVTHNGCLFEETLTSTGIRRVTTKECTKTEVHLFENEKAEKENKPLCTYDIPQPQVIETKEKVVAAKVKVEGKEVDGLTVNLTGSTKLKEITNTGPGGIAVCGIAVNGKGEAAFSNSLVVVGKEVAGGKAPVGVTLK